MRWKWKLIGVFGLLVLAATAASAADGRGRVDGPTFGPMADLGTLPGQSASDATGVNDAGIIVGSSGPSPVVWTPVAGSNPPVWEIKALSTKVIGEAPGSVIVGGRANGINAAGQIVGQVSVRLGGVGPPRGRAVVWDSHDSSARSLGVFGATLGSAGRAINGLGHVAGGGPGVGLVWRGGPAEALPMLEQGTSVVTYAINDAGVITGNTNKVPGGPFVPVAWLPKGTGYTVIELDNFGGTVDGSFDFGRGINDLGEIVGCAGMTEGFSDEGYPIALTVRAFVADVGDGHTWLRPGPLAAPPVTGLSAEQWAAARVNGSGNDVNNRSEIVGIIGVNGVLDAGLDELVDSRIAGYWRNGGKDGIALGTLGGSMSFARAISDNGFIVGLAATAAGPSHAFVIRRLSL